MQRTVGEDDELEEHLEILMVEPDCFLVLAWNLKLSKQVALLSRIL
jgi:hypothetical protein